METLSSVGLGDGAGVLEDGVREWGLAYAVVRVEDEGDGGGLEERRDSMAGLSFERFLATGKGKKSDMNGKPTRRMTVSSAGPEYAAAHAEHRSRTEYLGRKRSDGSTVR